MSLRPAATVCVFRDGVDGSEVLMAQRGKGARFMAGAWVFPGGVVDEADGGERAATAVVGSVSDELRPWVAAALRELVEEAQVWVTTEPVVLAAPEPWLRDEAVFAAAIERGRHFDADRVAYFANWITPTMVPVRFDTRFFAAHVDPGSRAFPEPGELDAVAWVTPHDAMAKGRSGEWTVPFPTMKTLEFLEGFASVDELMAHARSLSAVPAIQPRMRVAPDGALEVVLPGEPGFDELEDAPPDPDALARAAQAAAAKGTPVPEVEQ